MHRLPRCRCYDKAFSLTRTADRQAMYSDFMLDLDEQGVAVMALHDTKFTDAETVEEVTALYRSVAGSVTRKHAAVAHVQRKGTSSA